MGAAAGLVGTGGGGESSSATSSTGPQAGTTGSVILDFGGINLGNQDIPLNAQTTSAANAPPQVGNTPATLSGAFGSSTTILLLAGVALLAWYIMKRKK